jgi:hypothetical protein
MKTIRLCLLLSACATVPRSTVPSNAPPSEEIVSMVDACGSLREVQCPSDVDHKGFKVCYASMDQRAYSDACHAVLLPERGREAVTQQKLAERGCGILRIVFPAAARDASAANDTMVVGCTERLGIFN